MAVLDMKGAAKELGISYSLARQLVARGELPSARIGRRRVLRAVDVEAFLVRHLEGGPAQPPALPPVRRWR